MAKAASKVLMRTAGILGRVRAPQGPTAAARTNATVTIRRDPRAAQMECRSKACVVAIELADDLAGSPAGEDRVR